MINVEKYLHGCELEGMGDFVVFCKLHMKKVTHTKCRRCPVEGAPGNCEYTDEELKQTNLDGF
jgi:hypothetical protein